MGRSLKIHLGQRVRQLREEKGWTQSELAARLPGVRQQSIDQLERGHVKRPRFLPELADALGAQAEWLLTGEGPRSFLRLRRHEPNLDASLLHDVFIAVEHVLEDRGGKTPLTHKIKLICALYELMCAEGHLTAEKLKQAANNIVSYDQFLQKSQRRSV